uniref:Cytochrome P450 n=1 Tax=Leersia perrieri TaxID=77586 RepID=A0A0D9WES0_9ORYZ
MEAITAPFPVHLLAVTSLLLAVLYTVRQLLLVVVSRGKQNSPATIHRRLPPSPWRLPIIGNLHQVITAGRLPHRALRKLAAVHGPDVMLLRLGSVPTLVVSSREAAREVLQEQDHAFATRPSLAIPTRLLYGCTDIAFAPHGAYWRAARKTAVRHLLGPARVRSYRAVREQEAAELVRRVEEDATSRGGVVVELTDVLSAFAKDVAGRIILGVRASGGSGWQAKVDSLLHEANALLGVFHVGDYFPWLAWVAALDGTDAKARRAFKEIDRILEEIIVAAESDDDDGDEVAWAGRQDDAFVHVLLALQDDLTKTDARLNRDNVKALLEDLFGAGTDAIIIVLEWAMAELLCNNKAMRKLQHELRCSTKTNNLITEQDLPSMVYLRAVIKETIRLHPSGPLLIPRECMQHTNVHSYDVPRGTRVVINAWAIGRDPTVWDCADEFWPERFIDNKVDFRGQHFELIPFGAGRRMCPGIGFTMPLVELALANLVLRFNWEVPTLVGGAPKVLNMEEASGFAARKKVPLRAVAALPL